MGVLGMYPLPSRSSCCRLELLPPSQDSWIPSVVARPSLLYPASPSLWWGIAPGSAWRWALAKLGVEGMLLPAPSVLVSRAKPQGQGAPR